MVARSTLCSETKPKVHHKDDKSLQLKWYKLNKLLPHFSILAARHGSERLLIFCSFYCFLFAQILVSLAGYKSAFHRSDDDMLAKG